MRPVTRMELVDHIETAFTTGPANRGDMLAAANASSARPEVLAVLQQLPESPYRSVRDLWRDLADVPIGG